MLLVLALLISYGSVQAQSKRKKSSKITHTAKSKKGGHKPVAAKSKNMMALLQGKWQSLDDEKTHFVVEGDKQINFYGKDVLDTMTINFYKEYPVKIADSDPKLTAGTYLTAARRSNDFLVYSIDEITASKLVMMYLPRGSMLRYRKVK